MSTLRNVRKSPNALHIENGHGSSLRQARAYRYIGDIPGLAVGASIDLRFTTGDSAIVLESAEYSINQEDVTFFTYEDTTYSNNGTLITPNPAFNMNRVNPVESEVQFYSGAVVSSLGTLIVDQRILGVAGQNVNKSGFGAAGEAIAIVFKPNTEHLFRVTNDSALAVDVKAVFIFRETDASMYQAN